MKVTQETRAKDVERSCSEAATSTGNTDTPEVSTTGLVRKATKFLSVIKPIRVGLLLTGNRESLNINITTESK